MTNRIARFKVRIQESPTDRALQNLTLAIEDVDAAILLARSPEELAVDRLGGGYVHGATLNQFQCRGDVGIAEGMAVSHSPAPWRVDGVEIFDANRKHVVWELGNDNEADHLLIAAAPELLKALKALFASGLVRDFDSPEEKAAQSAIARAEGR